MILSAARHISLVLLDLRRKMLRPLLSGEQIISSTRVVILFQIKFTSQGTSMSADSTIAMRFDIFHSLSGLPDFVDFNPLPGLSH